MAKIKRRMVANLYGLVPLVSFDVISSVAGRPGASKTSKLVASVRLPRFPRSKARNSSWPALAFASGLPPESPRFSMKVDEYIIYFHPETNKLLEFVVLGFRRSNQGKIRYTVAYVDDDDVEVELSEGEMQDILYERAE